jgi:hypothetical protein
VVGVEGAGTAVVVVVGAMVVVVEDAGRSTTRSGATLGANNNISTKSTAPTIAGPNPPARWKL